MELLSKLSTHERLILTHNLIKKRMKSHLNLMDVNFRKCTFENWETDEHNEKLYKIDIRYCEKCEKMKRNNIGLLLYGPSGTGKSYLSFCGANRLLQNFVPVIAISII